MSTEAEIMAFTRTQDARSLDDAARIIRRRVKKPAGISTAAFCRVLLNEASSLRKEASDLLLNDDEEAS